MNKKEAIRNLVIEAKSNIEALAENSDAITISSDEKMDGILKGLLVYIKENNNLFSDETVITTLKERVNSVEEENKQLKSKVKVLNEQVIEAEKVAVIMDELSTLPEKAQEKIVTLAEKMVHSNIDEFKSNIRIIKESFNIINNDESTKKILSESVKVDGKKSLYEKSFLKERRGEFSEGTDVVLNETKTTGNTSDYLKF